MTARLLRFLAFALVPLAARAVVAADDQPATRPAGPPQWVVVTAPSFRAELDPLCDHRRAEGMDVVVVQTTDVLTPEQVRAGDAGPLRARVLELCRKANGTSFVLLVGAVKAAQGEDVVKTVVPSGVGTVGRMKGQPTDNAYGDPDKDLAPTVAVGRFPARTADEARAMVRKTLAFERDRSPGPWRSRLTLLAGNPGGGSAVEKRFAEWFVTGVAGTRFDRLDPRWTGRAVIHARQSPYCVPDEDLRAVSLRYLQEGQLFSLYMGHSNPAGLWSDNAPFLTRDDFAGLKAPHGGGVFFTCGCFSCQLDGPGGEGYGLSAIRNPAGPAAVVGAHGESYAAAGQLAGDGLLACLSRPDPSDRLADYWLAVTAGLARGPMDWLTFRLYDQADGSRGETPLAVQRKEHTEMWMLLGDPAMRLPLAPTTIKLAATEAAAVPGKDVTVSGTVPAALAGATVRLTLERPAGSKPAGLEPVAGAKEKGRATMLANHDRANDVVLAVAEVRLRDGQFEQTLRVPAEAPWARVVVRAVTDAADAGTAVGVLTLPVRQ